MALGDEIRGEEGVCRRRFIRLGVLAAAASVLPRQAFAILDDSPSLERSLSFYNTHTGESLKTVYWARGEYLSKALSEVNHILRDHRTGGIKSIDIRLLELLYAIESKLETQEPFHIISGYRSPKTNALLRKRGRGVAKNSLHQCGKAVDIRLPGCKLSLLRGVAMDLKGGGVGYYPRPNFVHVDVGRVRSW